MHPGLVVKLRPSGPWRIGPDSGARNRVDAIYHSDSLYSAVTSAMARLGSLEEWLDATGRPQEPAAAPAVCFSSCFPFLDDVPYVVPPRTVWPPASQASSARVRWKSARFVPLGIVQAILAGRKLDENQWTIDGLSECLAPAGSPGVVFRVAAEVELQRACGGHRLVDDRHAAREGSREEIGHQWVVRAAEIHAIGRGGDGLSQFAHVLFDQHANVATRCTLLD